MPSSSFFNLLCPFDDLDVAFILQRLSSLTGCVYLANNNMPVIAFSPVSYCIKKSNFKALHYVRDHQSEYTQTALQDLKSFIDIDLTKNSQNFDGFNGGYIGFFDYNFSANQQIHNQHRQQPTFFLGQYLTFLRLENKKWIFYSTEENAEEIFNQINFLIFQKPTSSSLFSMMTPCQARWDKTQYLHAFEQVQEYIQAGDCYQINLTQEFTAKTIGNLLDTAQDMWKLTNAPYAGYLKINDFELLSCSPELFIDFESERKIVTKPIKGTMPRYIDPILDKQSKQILKSSKKDQAENVMIVDLLRNDLSIYAETGTVKTPKLFEIESFNQVHHMVSEVTATLKSDIHPVDVLLSALPGGSITGAPKIRAMEIIEELEGAPRGAYCGSMGYFNFDGTGSWNILIRSVQKYQDELSVWAGGGITIASDGEAEYQECFDKVSAILDLLNTWYQPESSDKKSES